MKKKKALARVQEHSLGILNGNTITDWICFLPKNDISWKLHSRCPDGKALENSELFLLKSFPLEGPEFKREACTTNNRASVRGCEWHASKASVGLWAVTNANIRERLLLGQMWSLRNGAIGNEKDKKPGQPPRGLWRGRWTCNQLGSGFQIKVSDL